MSQSQLLDPKVRAVLEYADELLSDPARWTQGAYARAADGVEVDPDTDEAVTWCATGAIDCAANMLYGPHTWEVADAAVDAVTGPRGPLSRINDDEDQAAAYRAIRLLFARVLGIKR